MCIVKLLIDYYQQYFNNSFFSEMTFLQRIYTAAVLHGLQPIRFFLGAREVRPKCLENQMAGFEFKDILFCLQANRPIFITSDKCYSINVSSQYQRASVSLLNLVMSQVALVSNGSYHVICLLDLSVA